MPTCITRTRISPEAVSGPKFLKKLEKRISERIGNTETRVDTPWDRFVQQDKDASK